MWRSELGWLGVVGTLGLMPCGFAGEVIPEVMQEEASSDKRGFRDGAGAEKKKPLAIHPAPVAEPGGAQPTTTPEAAATPTLPLTLEAVLDAAVQSFPSRLAAEQRQAAAEGEQLTAEGGFDLILKAQGRWSAIGLYENRNVDVSLEQPTGLWGTTFFGGWRRGIGDYAVYDGKMQTATDGEVRAGFNIPLWRNGPIDRRRASLAQAELGRLIASHDYDAVLLDIQRVAAQRYWDWVFAGRRLAIAEELLGIAQRRDQGVRDRIDTGDAPAIEGTDNRRTILERQERVVAARRLLEQAGIQLSLYWRDENGDPLLPPLDRLPASFPQPKTPFSGDLKQAIADAARQRPELRRIAEQRKQAEIERDFAENQTAPGIDVSLLGAQDFGSSKSSLNRQELYAGINLDLPLQRRVARGRAQSAEANLQRLMVDYRLAEDRVGAEVRDSISALHAAQQRIAIAREQRAMALQLEAGERARLELGDSSLLLVNLRELASGDAAITEADALATFFKSEADYRAAMGLHSASKLNANR